MYRLQNLNTAVFHLDCNNLNSASLAEYKYWLIDFNINECNDNVNPQNADILNYRDRHTIMYTLNTYYHANTNRL